MTQDQIIETLLKNRGLESPSDISIFFSPSHPKNTPSPFNSTLAIQLIKQHIDQGNNIVIFGDYDVDGVCSTAILWETLHEFTDNVHPYIPHRRLDGYGLSDGAVSKVIASGAKLIIAVDCGIVSHACVASARSQGCDVIIIDHHESDGHIPEANVVLHSTITCAAGLVWLFCRDFLETYDRQPNSELLSLVALAVICDIVPLLGLNRSFAKFGLIELSHTTRPGLLALFQIAGINPKETLLTSYHCGFIIGPRLNAMGRLESALDSLRLICTTDPKRGLELAQILDSTNKERQSLTEIAVSQAISDISKTDLANLIVVADPSFDEGVIGLIAAKLVEKYHRPAVAISVGEDKAKGSARSIPGFHITDHLRQHSSLLTGVGGHAMAAGLSLSPADIPEFTKQVQSVTIDPSLLIKTHKFDLEIPLSLVNFDLLARLKEFEPFGLGNPNPTFKTTKVSISSHRTMGSSSQHHKFNIENLEAVWFNAPLEPSAYCLVPNDLIYQLGENNWNGRTSLQLLVRHLEV